MIRLSTCYMPHASYASLVMSGQAVLDITERFVKQNVRTRCHILSPNGVLPLIIPVLHEKLQQSAVKDVLISYKEPWQLRHLRSIKTAYGRSAFFEYFEEDLVELYNTRYEYLWEFNLASTKFLFQCMQSDMQLTPWDGEGLIASASYLSDIASPGQMPYQPDYLQVFNDRFPFVAGLSCLDLIMNKGPQSRYYLIDLSQHPNQKK